MILGQGVRGHWQGREMFLSVPLLSSFAASMLSGRLVDGESLVAAAQAVDTPPIVSGAGSVGMGKH